MDGAFGCSSQTINASLKVAGKPGPFSEKEKPSKTRKSCPFDPTDGGHPGRRPAPPDLAIPRGFERMVSRKTKTKGGRNGTNNKTAQKHRDRRIDRPLHTDGRPSGPSERDPAKRPGRRGRCRGWDRTGRGPDPDRPDRACLRSGPQKRRGERGRPGKGIQGDPQNTGGSPGRSGSQIRDPRMRINGS